MMAATPDYFHCITEKRFRNCVYEPEADTFLMLEALDKDAALLRSMRPHRCVEIGCGSGIVVSHLQLVLSGVSGGTSASYHPSQTDVELLPEYHVVDVNPVALEATSLTWSKTLGHTCSGAQPRLQLHQGDLFGPFEEEGEPDEASENSDCRRFDIILFNPPYVPTTMEEFAHAGTQGDFLTAAWCGGPRGRVVVDRFVMCLPRFLSLHGVCYIVAIRENNVNELMEMIRSVFNNDVAACLTVEVVAERYTGEHLSVIRVLRQENPHHTRTAMEEVTAPEPPPQLVRGVAIRIHQPRCSAVLLRIANKFFPLQPHASHLKRIRKVLRAEAVPSLEESLDAQINSATPHDENRRAPATAEAHTLELLLVVGHSVDTDLLKEFEEASACADSLTTEMVWVPDRAPRTSPDEWRKWCAVWPFAVPKPRPPSLLPHDDAAKIQHIFYKNVMPLATRVCGMEMRRMGAVLVDSNHGWRILATSDGIDTIGKHGATACFGLDPLPEGEKKDSIILEHPVIYVLKKLAHKQSTERDDDDEKEPYLANNVDLLVSHEPCIMCSMALVHSRVGRVYYCFPNSTHGGLDSRVQIHTIPSLNHHFRVFRCSTSWLTEEG